MKIKKPVFWDRPKPNIIAKVLYPISIIYGLLLKTRKKNYEKIGKIKTICVGNIYIGGTGKSSLAIEIKKILDNQNFKSCFIKKGSPEHLDEIELLKKRGYAYTENSRLKSLLNAVSDGYDYAIFDDGLHELDINFDLNIVCFNKKSWIGNGLLLPAGPLRENVNNIKNYEIVFFIGNNEDTTIYENFLRKKNPKLLFFNANYLPTNINEFDLKESYFAFSGIGNHDIFIDMLKSFNIKIEESKEFPDHYSYTEKDIEKIIDKAKNKKLKILTTEKDMNRIDKKYKDDIQIIYTSLNIRNKDKFINAINKI